jgi:DNA-binding transcriptional LysR family regulator
MELRDVDLNLLVPLDALLRTGSVTRAAEQVGLSTPAMSHALARLRVQLGDPVLVRAGRGMVLSERAQRLAPRVRALLDEVQGVLTPPAPLDLGRLVRTFRIHATDHVLAVLGPAIDRRVRALAPRVALQFLPNQPDDAAALREGRIDLAIGVYADLPPELRLRRLFDDRFVCVVRADHPGVGATLPLEVFLALDHVLVAPRGRPGSTVDGVLAELGHKRRVVRVVPYFLAALLLVAESDSVLTVSERIAQALAPRLGLRVLEPPLPLAGYTLKALWHPRAEAEPAHVWLRSQLVAAAEELASPVLQHPG